MKHISLSFLLCVSSIWAFGSIGAISGVTHLCVGDHITLSDTTAGGVWSCSHTTIAQIDYYAGVVYGVSQGIVTITYSKGGENATMSLYVNPHPFPIIGTSTICAGSHLTFTDSIAGGTWSTFSGNTSVSTDGILSGINAGSDTLYYAVTYTCGTAISKRTISVNPLPTLGPITGSNLACVNLTDTLKDSVSGGSWSSSSGTIATINGSGALTGHAAGTTTISYSKSISGCVSRMYLPITVNPLPRTGTITGLSSICVNGTMTLTDTVTGGIWSISNGNATISTAGVVSGMTAGIDTVYFSNTNICTTLSTKKYITVYPLPVSGTVSAQMDSVCINAYDTLHTTVSGGVWAHTNNTAAILTGGVVKGYLHGVDTIKYTVTSTHGCGSAVTTHVISVLPLPAVNNITGNNTICAGSVLTLNCTTTGGIWSNNNTLLDSVDVSTGMVKALTTGRDTIYYTLTNSCGVASKSKVITINPLPNAGTISATDSEICLNSSVTVSSSATGGNWNRSNLNANVSPTGNVTGKNTGIDTIRYIVSSTVGCGKDTASIVVTINPLPNSGVVTGNTNVCIGLTGTLHETVSGGSWVPSNPNVFVSDSGIVSPFSAGIDTVYYTVTTEFCGSTSSKIIVHIQTAANCKAEVENLSTPGTIHIYPNPAFDNTIGIDLENPNHNIRAIVSDLMGRKIMEVLLNHEVNSVNVTNLSKGMYLITCYNVDGTIAGTGKLVKN